MHILWRTTVSLTLLFGCASNATAKAFASAVMDISYIAWYRDDGDGVVDACGRDPQVGGSCDSRLTASTSLGRNLLIATTNDTASLTRTLDGDSNPNITPLSRSNLQLANPLNVPHACLGTGCNLSGGIPYPENDFTPPAGSIPTTQYSYVDQLLSGYFVDVFNLPGGASVTGGAALGARIDSSLPYVSTASGTAVISDSGTFTTQGTFNTYFDIEFVAQNIVSLSADETSGSVAVANMVFSINVTAIGAQPTNFGWSPIPLNLIQSLNGQPGQTSQLGDGATHRITSFDAFGTMFRLNANHTAILNIVTAMNTNALANQPPLPVPATLLLFAVGLGGLGWTRRRAAAKLNR